MLFRLHDAGDSLGLLCNNDFRMYLTLVANPAEMRIASILAGTVWHVF